MTNEKIPTKLILEVLNSFIAENKIKPPDAKGLRRWGEDIGELKNGRRINKLFSNWYYDALKVEVLSVRREIFEDLLNELNFDSLDTLLEIKDLNDKGKSRDPSDLRLANPPEIKEWFGKYLIGARLTPSILAWSPVFLVILFKYHGVFQNSMLFLILSLALSTAIIFATGVILAIFGKSFENKYFDHDGIKCFPSAYLMAFSEKGSFSERQKIEYREKVQLYFQLKLFNPEQETANKTEALQLLMEAGEKVKNVIDKKTLKSTNIQYGLIRNLVPATSLASILSLVVFIYCVWINNWSMSSFFALYFTFWVSCHLLLLRGNQVRNVGESYASYLLNEFLSR